MSGGALMTSIHTKESPRQLTSKSAYLALLCSLPVLLVFALLGDWHTGIGAAICCGLVILVVMVRWDLRKRWWFWAVILFGVALQVPIVLLVPWANRGLTGISVLPLGALDYGVVYGCVKLAEKMADRSEGSSSPS